jgi:trans-4-hydroxy-L-proline dehydratase
MIDRTERIARLVAAAMRKEVPSYRSGEGSLLWHRSWIANADASSVIVRRAAAKAGMHSLSTPVIDADELIVGKPCYLALTDGEQQELSGYERQFAQILPPLEGQASHMAVDYEKLLRLGLLGVKAEIVTLRAALNPEDPLQMEQDEFYKACIIALDGVAAYAASYAAHALLLAQQCSDEKRKAELMEIAAVLQKVPAHRAESFREALQSVHFLTFCLEGLYQLGRPDRYLLGYYRQDVAKGALTAESALELIDGVCILYNEYIPKGLAAGFMVGGRDAEGHDVSNELTALFLESIGHTRMIYPGVGLCCTPDTPQALLDTSCSLLAQGLSHPALFNDDVITKGLKGYGLTDEEACLYIHSTCVEITPIASSAVWVASPYINLAQLLLDILGVGPMGSKGDGYPPWFAGFDELKLAYRSHLHEVVRREAIEQNRQQMNRSHFGGDPLVSCFVNDCLARGKDVDQGGARHNWIMPSFVGLSNVADSLVAIRMLVYENNSLSLGELAEALKADFAGHEELRLEIANRIPKYGNDDDTADGMVQEIARWITDETEKFRTFRGDKLIPSLFCWIMHERLGSQTAATPDGRRCAFPLGDGSGPAQGREKKGPTASILSSTKWKHDPFIGGIAVNMKFNKNLFGPQALSKMASLIRTFLQLGGFELQINVVDRETLLKARAHPEDYGDLIVRVGGYSDYFVHLPPAMQEEVLERTGHEL